jgi:hypothetical protein
MITKSKNSMRLNLGESDSELKILDVTAIKWLNKNSTIKNWKRLWMWSVSRICTMQMLIKFNAESAGAVNMMIQIH